MTQQENTAQLKLHYTILCEDVRLEVGQKLSLIGVFYAIQVPQLPINVLKLVILNHWSGGGQYLSEVRILTPDRTQPVAVSQPSAFEIPAGGYADNVTLFANVTFPVAGDYVVQTLVNSTLFAEQALTLMDVNQPPPVSSETIQ
ncbi:MAG TPA: hypothetical protein VIS78_00080 [Blastocatellia bacterium]